MAEELGAAKARMSEAETRKSAAIQKLSDEHDDMARKYQSEVGNLFYFFVHCSYFLEKYIHKKHIMPS